MDKLTVEEKAKRYDEAFGIARNVWRFSSNNAEIMRMEELFPELKESEDEEVRKIILDQMKCWNEDAIQKNCEIDIEASSKCIAWVEKQGEMSKMCPTSVQDEQQPIDKVEPKFKVGDWIIHQGTENIYQVVACIDNQYQLRYGDNYTIQKCADVDRCARLWDITKDAKPGDVLIDKSGSRKCPFIFKETKPSDIKTDMLNPLAVLGYCGIGGAGFTKGSGWGDSANCIYYPATKEQRDTLFKAMADAGWEFDFEKKELKKIEQKSQRMISAEAKGAKWADAHLWHPADGDDLPEIDREVVVLYQRYPLEGNEYAVGFAHRPREFWDGKNIATGEVTRYYPKRYDRGGWNSPNIKWWLDLDLPKKEE